MAKADGGASPLDPATDGLEVPSPKRQKLDQSAEDILMDIFSVQDTLNSDAEIEALAEKVGMKVFLRRSCEMPNCNHLLRRGCSPDITLLTICR